MNSFASESTALMGQAVPRLARTETTIARGAMRANMECEMTELTCFFKMAETCRMAYVPTCIQLMLLRGANQDLPRGRAFFRNWG